MLLKLPFGIPKNRRNSPLLAALGIEKIDQLIKRQQLTLLRNAQEGNSKARTFYMGKMKMYNQGAKEYVILNDYHCINIYLEINMKRSAK